MTILRCTNKLQKRLKTKMLPNELSSDGMFGDWSCNLVYIGKAQAILCVSHATRLPVFVPAAKGGQFPSRLQSALGVMLNFYGATAWEISAELAHFSEITYAKTNNRSVLGTMNDYVHMSAYYAIENDTTALLNFSLKLAETPCGPLNYQSPDRLIVSLLAKNRQTQNHLS